MKAIQLLIFTDLDGSLLDHYSYCHRPADAMLKKLKVLEIPVIANTSKTFDELVDLRESLNNTDPFIAENGAVVYLPKAIFPSQPADCEEHDKKYWQKSFCPQRPQWQALINSLSEEFTGEFQTFEQGGISAIMEWTGLNKTKAGLASKRQYGEPVHWLGTERREKEFTHSLQKLGATVLKGGRFIHVSGKSDKGQALNWLRSFYQQTLNLENIEIITLAIGDGDNDIAMLEAADYALVIKSPVNPAPKLFKINDDDKSRLLYSKADGPEGWAEGVEKILQQLKIEQPET